MNPLRRIARALFFGLSLGLLFATAASSARAQIGISITIAPPVLPEYEQPYCPAPNYIWTPGYWAYGPGGYYWVPGTWVMAPAPGLLWTPGYWGWGGAAYLWHAGYWGPTVGFYGGVNYGYGYPGDGFYGGRWNNGYFSYNTAVMRVNTTIIRNTYVDRTVIVNRGGNRVSFNGGRGGIQARPNAMQQQAERQRRFGPTGVQSNQERFARDNKANWASQNHGRPAVAALQRPAGSAVEFNRGNQGGNRQPENRPGNGARPGNETRPGTPGHNARPAPGNTARPGNSQPGAGTRPNPGVRPSPGARPETRPTPANHSGQQQGRPAPQQQARPAQQQRPQARPAQPAARPQQQQARPQAQARPQEQQRPQQQDRRPQ